MTMLQEKAVQMIQNMSDENADTSKKTYRDYLSISIG